MVVQQDYRLILFLSHKITYRDDPDNPNQVLVSLPYPSII